MRISSYSIRYLPGVHAFTGWSPYDRACIYREINFYSVTMELLGDREVLYDGYRS